MASPELPLSEFDRAPEPGQEGSGQPREDEERNLRALVFESLERISTESEAAAEFEDKLKSASLTSMVEAAGLLPVAEEGTIERREAALKLLYAGAILSRNFNEQLFPSPSRHSRFILYTPPVRKSGGS